MVLGVPCAYNPEVRPPPESCRSSRVDDPKALRSAQAAIAAALVFVNAPDGDTMVVRMVS